MISRCPQWYVWKMLTGIREQGRKKCLSVFRLTFKQHSACYKLEHPQRQTLSAARHLHRLFQQIGEMWERPTYVFFPLIIVPKHLHWWKVGHCFEKRTKNVIKNGRSSKDCPESKLAAGSEDKLAWRIMLESNTVKNVLASFFCL